MRNLPWDEVLKASEMLQAQLQQGINLPEIYESLKELEKAFPKNLDPLDEYSEYCFRRFCKALQEVIFKLSTN